MNLKSATNPIVGIFFLLILFSSCAENKDSKDSTASSGNSSPSNPTTQKKEVKPSSTPNLFKKVSASKSGLQFSNQLKETEESNILTYEYLYNGAGVAVGDINNDGLPDIFMAGNLAPDALFLNKGDLIFEDISQASGILSMGFSTGVTMVDINADGWLDIYICRSVIGADDYRKNILLINNKNNTFTNQAQAYGLDNSSYSNHANFFDYDNDGDLDCYLINHRLDFGQSQVITLEQDPVTGKLSPQKLANFEGVTDVLYQNNGSGKFIDVTNKAGLLNKAYGLSSTIFDVNQDGWMDIYVCNDYIDKDHLYINQKNGKFKDELNKYFLHTSRNSMGSDAADINNDGLLDFISVDMLAEDNARQKLLKGHDPYDKFHKAAKYSWWYQVMQNTLHLNNGSGVFSEIAGLAGVTNTDWSWAPLFADFDNDGYNDLFISNGYRRDVTNLDYAKYGFETEKKKLKPGEKMTNLKLIETIPTTPVENYIFQNQGNLKFVNRSSNWGLTDKTFSQGTVYSDLDNDGDLDLVINNLDQDALLYENTASQQTDNNYLKIQLKGASKNTNGIGAKIKLITDFGIMYKEVTPTKGYFSSVDPIIHFGLNNQRSISQLSIVWPNGKEQLLKDVKTNQTLVLNQVDAKTKAQNKRARKTLLKDITAQSGIKYIHKENDFIDFKREPLLQQNYSNEGPFIEVADINGDGFDDFIIGGATNQSPQIYTQGTQGSFNPINAPALRTDAKYEDADLAFFDADGDSDLDLYIVSGGNEKAKNDPSYQDRLYINNGKGIFSKGELPKITSSGSCVVPLDFDKDGDLDLFVGGRSIPGEYPYSPQSYLLQNENGSFKNVSDLLPKNGKIGMVTDALFLNSDSENALWIVGEWMPLTKFVYSNDKWTDQTSTLAIKNASTGWWNCLEAADIDQDGDLDFLAGNRGINSYYKAAIGQPATIFAKDFDGNGSIDAVPCYYFNNGKLQPKHNRDELANQLPLVRKRFLRYKDYGLATINDILNASELKGALKLEAETFETSIFINEGSNKFVRKALPPQAQMAPVKCIRVDDINKDGKLDIALVGNHYGADVETGRYDACKGVILSGDGTGNFRVMPPSSSGFITHGDARNLYSVKGKNNKTRWLVSNNNGPLQILE